MKWEDTVASKCRYGDVAAGIFGNAEIIWEHSMDDYQGYANILAAFPDGTFGHYEWTYGSCSGCDEWESAGFSDVEVEQEMRNGMAILPSKTALKKYLHLTGKYKDAKVPTSNSPMNGSIPGMLRYMSGGISEDFKAMRATAEEWLEKEKTNGKKKKTKRPNKK